MKLIGPSAGTRVTKILIAANYAGIDLQVEDFYPRGQSEEVLAEFKKKNPNLLIPVLETPEGYLYESNAILRYIARQKDDSKLYGTSPYQQAIVDQYLDWVALTLEPAFYPIFLTLIGRTQYNKATYDAALDNLRKLLRIVDDRVKQSKYLAGDHPTIADFALFPVLNFLFRFAFDEKTRKAFFSTTKYFEQIASEENVKKVFGKHVLPKTALAPYTGSI